MRERERDHTSGKPGEVGKPGVVGVQCIGTGCTCKECIFVHFNFVFDAFSTGVQCLYRGW